MDTLLLNKITNRKISPTLGWADFRGFSLLFDNPGHNVSLYKENLLKIDGRYEEDLCPGFYQTLWNALASLNPYHLSGSYLFCPLPLSTYHVTVWDGLNDFNKIQLDPVRQRELQTFFDDLPGAFLQENPFTAGMYASPLNHPAAFRITFAFEELCLWGCQTLVATLTPHGAASRETYRKILQHRLALNQLYEREFGVKMRAHYAPHVSLGYFANIDLAQRVLPLLAPWNETFGVAMQECRITFESISPYGFTDMVTFFKRP